ncbi:hypothetical protein BGW42_005577 [Actinomortierella wolfii]|nr:hypothetical protein BGW42_005577 [Actinomortierella wolfii]
MFLKIAASSLFAALSVVSVVAGADFTICDSGYARIERLKVPPVQSGKSVCVDVVGSIDRRIEGGSAAVTASSGGTSYYNRVFDLCKDIDGISCPIAEGKHTFTKCINIPGEAYPGMTVSVHASAHDQNGDTIFCVGKDVTVQ